MNAAALAPGDFCCVSGGGDMGKLIVLGQRLCGNEAFAEYGHAFIYIGDNMIVEAAPDGARKALLRHDYRLQTWSSGIIRLTDGERAAIVASAAMLIGRGYSWLDYWAIGMHRRHIPAPGLKAYIASTKRLICSELVDQAYLDAGVHLFDDGRWSGYVVPADLAGLLLTRRPQHRDDAA